MRKLFVFTILAVLVATISGTAQSLFVTETSEQLGIAGIQEIFPGEFLAQEFMAHFDRLDFISVGLAVPFIQHQVRLHEGSVTGAVVAVSSEQRSLQEAPDDSAFTFSGPVALLPGATYVMEIVVIDPRIEGFSQVWLTRDTYSDGGLLLNGVPVPDYDLAFSVGVFIPRILSADALTVTTMERQAVLIAPTATFTNGYISDYRGSTLAVTVEGDSDSSDSLSVSGLYDEEVLLRFESNVVGIITKTILPRSLTVEFNSRASAAAVQTTMRSLVYSSSSFMPPASRSLRMTFTHPLGTITIPIGVGIVAVNDAPVALPQFVESGRFLGNGVFIASRRNSAAVAFDASGSFDPDSRIADYLWTEMSEPLANQGVRVTNTFFTGIHAVALTVIDQEGLTNTQPLFFEVITVREALNRLIMSVSEVVPAADQRRLRTPLKQAKLAIAQQRRALAKNILRRFQQRVAIYGESDPVLGQFYVESAQRVIDALE